MVNFRVGDKVRVLDAENSKLAKNDIGVVKEINEGSGRVFVDGKPNYSNWITYFNLELVDSKPTKKQLIQALEERVATLEKLVEDYFKLPVEPSTDDVEVIEFEGAKYRKVERLAREGDVVIFRSENIPNLCLLKKGKPYRVVPFMNKICAEHDEWTHYEVYVQNAMSFRTPETVDVYELIPSFTTYEGQDLEAEYAKQVKAEKTPNQLRAEIIEKAKWFVEESKRELSNNRGKGYVIPFGDDPELGGYICDLDFVVNDEKRTVVALLTWNPLCEDAKIKGRGIAKCNPSDVFNEHIGKAIALGRALGLDVSEFEGAVQPTFAKGQIIEGATERNPGVIKERECYGVRGDDVYTMSSYLGWLHAPYTKIINDTNAIYRG